MPEVARDDRRIHYRVEGDGPALVLIPGIGAGARLFGTLPRRFARAGFRCAVVDPVGLPPSSPLPDATWTFAEAALDVLAVCEQLGAEVTLVGTSLGGKVGLAAAARNPGIARRLVMLASAVVPTERARRVYRFFQLVATELPGDAMGELIAPFLFGTTFHQRHPAVVEDLVRAMRPTPESRALMAAQARALLEFDGIEIARHAAVPALCLAGDEDTLTPQDEVEATARLLPDAEFACLPAAGHSLLLESGEAFDAVVAFARRA